MGLWLFHFPAFLIPEGFGNGDPGASQRELAHPCPDGLLNAGAASSISALMLKPLSLWPSMQRKTRNHGTAVIRAIRFSASTSLRLPRSCCLNLPGNPASPVPAASPGLSPGCFPSSASSLINTGCSHPISLMPDGDASPAGTRSIPYSPSYTNSSKITPDPWRHAPQSVGED